MGQQKPWLHHACEAFGTFEESEGAAREHQKWLAEEIATSPDEEGRGGNNVGQEN